MFIIDLSQKDKETCKALATRSTSKYNFKLNTKSFLSLKSKFTRLYDSEIRPPILKEKMF